MPTPRAGETRKDFIQRCIPIVIDDGTAKDGSQAAAVCNSMWEQDKMSAYLLDEFVTMKAGEPYRLFPFGKIVKKGIIHEITPEYARRFRLPHFKPPIKLGSHEETTPAGGSIIALEVREDGLYAVPEWNDKGETSMKDGAYRYQSPEVIWEGGALEDPQTGDMIEGPMIVGDALLHTPHLGDAAALYQVEPFTKGDDMSMETVQVPKDFWESIKTVFKGQPEPEPQKPEQFDATQTDEYKAVAVERDTLKAQLAEIEAENKKNELVSQLTAELQDKEKFGMQYVELKGAQEAANVLATMDEVQREWVMRNFKAVIAQVKLGDPTKEVGKTGTNDADTDPVMAFDAEVQRVVTEDKLIYAQAALKVAQEKPELYKAYKEAKEK
jgi:hypothetical protein